VAKEETIAGGVAGRYASALFGLAQESRATDRIAGELLAFDKAIAESPDLARLVGSPLFSAVDQTKALNKLMEKAGIAGITANFVRLVAQKRRLFLVRDMIRAYGALNDAAKGVTRAKVTAAHPLDAAHVEALKDVLRDVTKGRSVDVDVTVDPSIIGGLVVRLGSRMVDGSIRTKLNALRTRMKEAG
jgi:F-type H+-transporting ATPase subunit delta